MCEDVKRGTNVLPLETNPNTHMVTNAQSHTHTMNAQIERKKEEGFYCYTKKVCRFKVIKYRPYYSALALQRHLIVF